MLITQGEEKKLYETIADQVLLYTIALYCSSLRTDFITV